MNIVFDDVSLAPPIEPVPGHTVELERLGEEIAELSAHLDAAISLTSSSTKRSSASQSVYS